MADQTPARVWDNTATYEAYMGRWSRPVAEAILAWLGPAPGLRWLDVGCGTGALTQAILGAAEPRAILGVDPSAEFLATAGQIADPRVRFAIGDARDLPVPSDTYDMVIAGLVLHFVPEPQAAVVAMMRAAARSVASICIFPLQDVLHLGSEARMNTPAASYGNWAWRYHSDALHLDFAVQLAALMEMTDRDGYVPPQPVVDTLSSVSAESSQTI